MHPLTTNAEGANQHLMHPGPVSAVVPRGVLQHRQLLAIIIYPSEIQYLCQVCRGFALQCFSLIVRQVIRCQLYWCGLFLCIVDQGFVHLVQQLSYAVPQAALCNKYRLTALYCVVNLAPSQGRGSSTHRVCLCVCLSVCYRSSGRYGYLMSPSKVSTESAQRNEQNKPRNFATNVQFESYDRFLLIAKTLLRAYATKSTSTGHQHCYQTTGTSSAAPSDTNYRKPSVTN